MPKILVLSLSVVLQAAGVWSQYGAASMSGACSVPSYHNCPGPNYRVISYTSNTSNFLQVAPAESDGAYIGFIWDLMNALKDIASFNFTVSLAANGVYGAPDVNGNWNGMVGQLMGNNVDIIAADFSMSPERETAIDFTVPFMYYHLVRITLPNASLDGIKYAIVKDGADYTYLQSSVDPVAQAIWNNIQANAPTFFVKDDAAGLALVRQGGWAYVTEDAEVAVALRNSNGQFVITGPHLQRSFYGLGVRHGDKLAKTLSINIAKTMENGKMQQILVKWGFTN